ncbi:MAG TPA: hypothetical protein VLB80_04080 [Candidatus Babeliales bacterium]|nr:hypothetical protein [Candidatus Babeliales bacterium]
MVNKYLSSLFCIITLTLTPACCKRQKKNINHKDAKVTIEVDNTIFEIKDIDEVKKSINKF